MIVVIGAGLAGLTAALHLAQEGVDVTLCEAHPSFLGGRTRARDPYRFEWGGATHEHSLDHGQHCMWFQYYNMRRLLVRLGLWETSIRECWATRYVVDDGQNVIRLPPLDVRPGHAPANRLEFLRDLARAAGVTVPGIADAGRLVAALPRLLQLATFRHHRDYQRWDQISVSQMFAWIGLPEGMDQIFKSLCKASTFHRHTEISAAWGLSMVESTLIHDPRDHKMWCFRGNLGTHLIDPLATAVQSKGGKILLNAKAVDFELSEGRITAVRVEPTVSHGLEGSTSASTLGEAQWLACDAVISATDIPGAQRLLLPTFSNRDDLRRIANLDTVANATVRVVTSRRVREDEPWLGIFSGNFEWLDCYFLLSRYQDEFMKWSAATGGEVIELHCYFAQREVAACHPDMLRENIEREVVRVWPELEGAIVHIEHFVNERTFDKQTVGHHEFFPPMQTSVPNLTLCGSWPSLDSAVHDMEKAVVTGILAANRILAERQRPLTPIIPLRPSRLSAATARLAANLLPRPTGVASSNPRLD
jgi:isorenieratene synthase